MAERYDGMPLSASARLYQVLEIDKTLRYDFGTHYDTDPELGLTDIHLKFCCRLRFYRH